MRARHTQARPQRRAITSKALVNCTRMKVVKMKLTKAIAGAAAKNPFVVPAQERTLPTDGHDLAGTSAIG